MRRDLAVDLVADIRRLGEPIRQLETQLAALVSPLARILLAIWGVNVVTAAKILGEVAVVTRFRSAAAFAMHTGTAPIPVWSSGRPQYRLNRGGNRRLNACLHRIAITQLNHHPAARAWRDRWTPAPRHRQGRAPRPQTPCHLVDVVYRALLTDHHQHQLEAA